MVDLTFNYTEYAIQPTEIQNTIEGFRAVIKRMYPANTFYETIARPAGKPPIGYFDYRSYALDADLYNLLFVAGIHERLLIGSFSFLHDDRKWWAVLVRQMLGSMLQTEEKQDPNSPQKPQLANT